MVTTPSSEATGPVVAVFAPPAQAPAMEAYVKTPPMNSVGTEVRLALIGVEPPIPPFPLPCPSRSNNYARMHSYSPRLKHGIASCPVPGGRGWLHHCLECSPAKLREVLLPSMNAPLHQIASRPLCPAPKSPCMRVCQGVILSSGLHRYSGYAVSRKAVLSRMVHSQPLHAHPSHTRGLYS